MEQTVMNKLSKRIKELINLCGKHKVYADIGCDHGYITLELLKQNKAEKVYAVDIHSKSLDKTKILLEENKLESNAEFIVSDGFTKLYNNAKSSIDCAVIAGIGGKETIKILQQYQPNHLVLQPMKNVYELRIFLVNNGYFIEKDYLFKEKNKFYDFISCKKGESQQLTTLEL